MLQSDFYLLGDSEPEHRRLLTQTGLIAPEAEHLLDKIEISQGAKAIDLGCGPRGVLDLLSKRVGPSGGVVGVERNPRLAAAAEKFVTENGLENVAVLRSDARATGLPRSSFDIVFARLVLVNVPNPKGIVAEMVALARPGGIVVSYEADLQTHLCDPPSAAWDRLVDIYKKYSAAHGVDLFVGRKTHLMLKDAGIVGLEVTPIVHVHLFGHPRRTILLDFIENARARLIEEGFVSQAELVDLAGQLRIDLDDPRRLVVSHQFYAVWGRKP
jgi:ubiquinone/menaquinone biosynthesis C-methylase UbiE